MPKILIVLSGSDRWTLDDGTQHPTGFWAEELLAPLEVFADASIEVDLASPAGRTPVVDDRLVPGKLLGRTLLVRKLLGRTALARASGRPAQQFSDRPS